MTTIDVSARNPHGKEIYDPRNDAARALAALMRTKTLSRHALDGAIKLGHQIRVVPAPAVPVRKYRPGS